MGEKALDTYDDVLDALMPIYDKAVKRRDGARVAHDVDISPELCAAILRHCNQENIRTIDQRYVAQYSGDIASGAFVSCYDPLIFKPNMMLANGQHRCAAAARAGKGLQQMVVIFDAVDGSRRGIDAGRGRTVKQTHDLDTVAASMVNMAIMLMHRASGISPTAKSKIPSRSDLRNFYDKHRDVFDYHRQTLGRRPITRESHISGAFAFAEIQRPEYKQDIRLLCDDVAGEQSSSAARAIADHVVVRKRAGIACHSQTDRLRESAMFLRAMQCFVLNASVTTLTDPGDIRWWAKEVAEA